MILAIGNAGAYEVEAFRLVASSLGKRGEEALLFKQDLCLEGEVLNFEVKDGKSIFSIVIDGVVHNIDDFRGVWYLKPHLPRELLEYEPVEHRRFIDVQFRRLRHALWSISRDKNWLNDPWASERAENKLLQLKVATEIGFSVPDTMITSDPDQVRSFWGAHGGVVVKMVATSPILDHIIPTSRVTAEVLAEIESVRMCPSIFQAEVPKDYELRITVVGQEIFAAKILSQGDPATEVDWRVEPENSGFEVKMEQTSLPDRVEEMIFSFVRAMGLQFGCIDMIVTPEGKYVFLEINPNGQWYFVQLKTGAGIASAISEVLVRGRAI